MTKKLKAKYTIFVDDSMISLQIVITHGNMHSKYGNVA